MYKLKHLVNILLSLSTNNQFTSNLGHVFVIAWYTSMAWLGSSVMTNFLYLTHVLQWHLPIIVLLTELDWSWHGLIFTSSRLQMTWVSSWWMDKGHFLFWPLTISDNNNRNVILCSLDSLAVLVSSLNKAKSNKLQTGCLL